MKDRVEILVLSSKGRGFHFDRLRRHAGGSIRPGHRVSIDGEGDEFVVLRVDQARHVADLLRQGSVSKVEAGIALTLLRVIAEPDLVEPGHDLPASA